MKPFWPIRRKRAVKILFTVGPITEQPMPLIMSVTQQCDLSIQPVDSRGNPAPVDGVPVWSVANSDLASLNVADDGMSATLVASGTVGDSQVNVTADADLGEGVRTISGLLDVSIKPAEAVSLGVTAGTPVEQPTSPATTEAPKSKKR